MTGVWGEWAQPTTGKDKCGSDAYTSVGIQGGIQEGIGYFNRRKYFST
jgi:hypothetical protein